MEKVMASGEALDGVAVSYCWGQTIEKKPLSWERAVEGGEDCLWAIYLCHVIRS